MSLPDPKLDGVEHINTWTKAATRFGRLITNLSDIATNHPVYGRFRTMEGLWYYLRTGMQHEDLRAMNGFEAKAYGSKLEVVWNKTFYEDIKLGIRAKIDMNEELSEAMREEILPFEHYYVYNGKVVVPKSSKVFCGILEEIRNDITTGR